MDNVEIIEFTDSCFMEANNPYPTIYPRFKKVRDALIESVYGSPTSEVHRDFRSMSWSEGIIDYRGSIEGIKDGIRLSFKANGTTIPRQPYCDINEEELVIRARKEEFISLVGNFISKDELEGSIEIIASDGEIVFEGYWLEDLHGDLVLEQVVDINKNVHTLKEIEKMPINKIYICKNSREINQVYSLGGTRRQIFDEGLDKIERLERMQTNREFKVPGMDSPIPMRKRKILGNKK